MDPALTFQKWPLNGATSVRPCPPLAARCEVAIVSLPSACPTRSRRALADLVLVTNETNRELAAARVAVTQEAGAGRVPAQSHTRINRASQRERSDNDAVDRRVARGAIAGSQVKVEIADFTYRPVARNSMTPVAES